MDGRREVWGGGVRRTERGQNQLSMMEYLMNDYREGVVGLLSPSLSSSERFLLRTKWSFRPPVPPSPSGSPSPESGLKFATKRGDSSPSDDLRPFLFVNLIYDMYESSKVASRAKKNSLLMKE